MQLSSPEDASALLWVADLYYFRATTDQLTENILRPPDGTYVNVLNNQLGFGPGPHVTPNSQDVTTPNYAAFGQATLAATARLNLPASLIYTTQQKKGPSAPIGDRAVSRFPGPPALPSPIPCDPLPRRNAGNT